ncbi:hypothetical protein HDU96_007763 [Phlyctochytrium bullatum]|nr:hypothetical protein HDU96_007763 [Phlyctochytrium bullatum]
MQDPSFGMMHPMNISGPLALSAGYSQQGAPMRRNTSHTISPTPASKSSLPSPLTTSSPLPFSHQRRPSGSDSTSVTPSSPAPPVPPLPAGFTSAPAAPAPVKSLFQSCMSMIEKLYGFPMFEWYLFPDGVEAYQADPPPLIDPVAILWACFRLGAPLCTLYNQLNPRAPLKVADVTGIRPPKYTNVCKDNVYRFIVSCKNELGLSEQDVFAVSDPYKEDTNSFVKVLHTVEIVLEKIESLGLLPERRPLPFSVPSQDLEAPTDNRSKLINELIDTERKYINDLEVLHSFEREALHQNILSRDEAVSLFANLDMLLDFQRRFLIAMETTLSLPTNEQRIGQLFLVNEDSFSVYHAFCANYMFGTTFALQESERLSKLSHLIAPHMIQSYLIKPVQRVCKYPLLLNELVKLSENTSYPYVDELKEGHEAIKRVTERVNEMKRVEENRQMKNELTEKMEDWKGLKPNDFGALLLYDRFIMISNEVEKEFNLYLFEQILLCCKDMTKSRRKSTKREKGSDGPQFALKGNIFVNSIASVQDTSDPSIGYFGLKVHWKDVTDMENFALKCRNEEQVRLWKDRMEKQIEADRARKRSIDANAIPPGGFAHGFSQAFINTVGMGSVDDYPDSGYAGSVYRPSFDSMLPLTPGAGGQPYQSPPIARSRSIPHNYYPGNPALAPPLPQQPPSLSSNAMLMGGAAPQQQRRSQVQLSRGYGSQVDLAAVQQQQPAYYGHAGVPPRALSASPDAATQPMFHQHPGARAVSPPPPVPSLPHHLMARGNSGQGGVPAGLTLPAPPVRTFSSTAAAVAAAAATGGAPPAGYSDDEASDDEYYMAMRQHHLRGVGGGRVVASPTPPSVTSINTAARKGSEDAYAGASRSAFFASPTVASPTVAGAGGRYANHHHHHHYSHQTAAGQHPYHHPHHHHHHHHPPAVPGGGYGGVPLGRTRSGPAELDSPGGMVGAAAQAYYPGPYGLVSSTGSAAASPGQKAATYSPGTRASIVPNPYQAAAVPDPLGFVTSRGASGGSGGVGAVAGGMAGMSLHERMPSSGGMVPPSAGGPVSASVGGGGGAMPALGASNPLAGFIKVRTHYEQDTFVIAVPSRGATFAELQARIERKIQLCGGKTPADQGRRMRIRYKDEEGDMVALGGDADVAMAFEMARKGAKESVVLNLYVA